jgi:hypothetical protein
MKNSVLQFFKLSLGFILCENTCCHSDTLSDGVIPGIRTGKVYRITGPQVMIFPYWGNPDRTKQ